MFKKAIIALPLIIANIIFMFLPFLRFAVAEELVISENGSGSDSEIVVQTTSNTTVEQSNSADVNNEVDLESNTGENQANENTGQVTIETGEVAQELQIENKLNYSVVEIPCCPNEFDATITSNGSDSTNQVNVSSNNETTVSVNQYADVQNNVSGIANTGENTANQNGGSVDITTGDIYVLAKIKTGPVNVEKITGGNGGGSVSISVDGNGADSENLVTVLLNDLARINVNNNANIENNIDWDLNTGRNEANGNLGDVSIRTGNILFDLFVENGPINVGGIDWGCCEPKDDHEDPDEPDVPGDGGNGGNGGGGNGGGGGGVSISDILGVSAGPAVLGLSATNGLFDNPLTFWFGLMLLVTGAFLYQRNAPTRKNFAAQRR